MFLKLDFLSGLISLVANILEEIKPVIRVQHIFEWKVNAKIVALLVFPDR